MKEKQLLQVKVCFHRREKYKGNANFTGAKVIEFTEKRLQQKRVN